MERDERTQKKRKTKCIEKDNGATCCFSFSIYRRSWKFGSTHASRFWKFWTDFNNLFLIALHTRNTFQQFIPHCLTYSYIALNHMVAGKSHRYLPNMFQNSKACTYLNFHDGNFGKMRTCMKNCGCQNLFLIT